MSEIADVVVGIARTIRACRFRYVDEDRLQEGIAAALAERGFVVEREVRLDARNRLDILVDHRIGVEVKIAGSRADLQRQVDRYLLLERIDGLVLVTSRSSHLGVTSTDKPLATVCLNGAGL